MKAKVILYKSKKLMSKGEATGEFPLMLRLTDRNKRKYIALGFSLPEKNWDFIKGEVKGNPENKDKIIAKISELETKYKSEIAGNAIDRKKISLDTLQNKVDKPVRNDYTVFQWFELLISDYKTIGNYGQVRAFKSAYGALKTFLNDKDIAFDEIDLPFLHRYLKHLKMKKHFIGKKELNKERIEKPISPATISVYFRELRSALNKAIREGFAKEYPFKDFKIKKSEPNKRAITLEQMDAILKLDYKTDYFRFLLFSYSTIGMNFVDLSRLTWDNVRGNEIHYTRQKIHHKIVIPIHSRVKEILDYYRPITGKTPSITGLNDNYIFPILNKEIHKTEAQIADRVQKSRKQFNNELKVIGIKAGTDVPLSSYVFRHSAITHLIQHGINIDAVQALAGHKRISTTENYIREANDRDKRNAVNSL